MLALPVLVTVVRARIAHVLAHRSERGQAVAEYALVLIAAAAVAVLVGKWAASTKVVDTLLDAVIGKILDKAKAQ